MSGKGTYYYTSSLNGERLIGTFKNNAPVGTCTYYTASGVKYKTTWSKGICTKVKKG